jgi:hypothetical protein
MPLVLPKSDTPISDEERPGIFGKVWWLFLWTLMQYLQNASTLTIDMTLTAASTKITPKADAAALRYIIRQDAVGGRAITWDSAFFSGATTTITTTANTISGFEFAWSPAKGKYVMVGQPSTGMAP